MSPYATELIHLEDVEPRTGFAAKWQQVRHRQAHWFVEMVAEAFGAFIYCWAGGASAAAYVLGNLADIPGLGSLWGAGFGYGFGVVLALVVCAATSGAHFNPSMTIVQVLFKGFPVLKGCRYIVAQIFGAYVAFGFLYLQYKPTIALIEQGLTAKGLFDKVMFEPTGPAGIFALYAPPGYPLGTVFLNEFMIDFVLGVVIFACVDPTNLLVPPAAVPWVVGFSYTMAISGFVPNGMAANTARDLGGRLMAITIWGTKATGGSSYAAIAALTNIPATILAALFYNFMLSDSHRVLNPSSKLFIDAHKAHAGRLDQVKNGGEVYSHEASSSTEKV